MRRNAAFTLIELMIAIAMGLIIIGVVAYTLRNAGLAVTKTTNLVNVSNRADMVLTLFGDDFENACVLPPFNAMNFVVTHVDAVATNPLKTLSISNMYTLAPTLDRNYDGLADVPHEFEKVGYLMEPTPPDWKGASVTRLGEFCRSTMSTYYDMVFECTDTTSTAITASSEPDWGTLDVGDTKVDGNVTWTARTAFCTLWRIHYKWAGGVWVSASSVPLDDRVVNLHILLDGKDATGSGAIQWPRRLDIQFSMVDDNGDISQPFNRSIYLPGNM